MVAFFWTELHGLNICFGRYGHDALLVSGTPQLHYKDVGVACVNVLLAQVGVACDPGGSDM